ncbi:hypothetical protein [Actinophytocola glycyrrhizae]|uniref:Uncharacterized protein n=1 Tax=Actinophytocola glycyrrhizae TaxID=2044873 RepID=A0ABV9S2V2_9PSEU
MQTWAKRGLQTALVTGGLLMLGTGIASADEDVNPDKPASPLDGSVTVPVHIDNNVLGTPFGQKNVQPVHKDVAVDFSQVTGALPVAKATQVTDPLVARATAPAVTKVQSAVAPLPQQGRDFAAPLADKATPVADKLRTLPGGDKLPPAPSLDKVNVPAVDKVGGTPGQDNQINTDLVVPVDLSGNAVALVGKAETTNDSHHGYGTYRDTAAGGAGSFVGGNVVDLDWALPVQVTNNAVAGFGKASAAGTTSQEAWATGNIDTAGSHSVLGGNVVAPQFATPVQADGNAVAGGGFADATSEAATAAASGGSIRTTGADSVGGGNAVPVPVAVPARLNGNAVMGLGRAAAATESTADATSGTTRTGKHNVPTYVETSGEPALAAGNVVQPATSGPAMLCGNAGGVGGSADATCDAATTTDAGDTNRSTGAGSVASGAIADAPVALPVQGFGNAAAGVGEATAVSENAVDSTAGGASYTRGHGSALSGTVAKAPVSGSGDVFANSMAASGHAGSAAQNDAVMHSGGHAGTTGDDSLAGGDMIAVPVVAPGEAYGNAAAAGSGGAEAAAVETKTTKSGSGRNTDDDYGVLASNLVTVPVATAAQLFGNGAGALAATDAKASAVEEVSAGGDNRATGTAGLGSGNIGQVPVSMPFQVFGSGVSGFGKGTQAAVNQTEMEAGGDSVSDGTRGTGSGNVVTAPVAGAGQVYGESFAAQGVNRALAASRTETEAGGDTVTSGRNGLGSGNVAAPQALPLAQSFAVAAPGVGGTNAAAATNDTDAESGGDIDTTGDQGVLSGNLADVPAAAAVQPFGTAVAGRSYAQGLSHTKGKVGGTSTTSGAANSLSGMDDTVPAAVNAPIYDVPVDVLARAMAESANNSDLQVGESDSHLTLPVTGVLSPTELPSFAALPSFAPQRSVPSDDVHGTFTGMLPSLPGGTIGLPGRDRIGDVADLAVNGGLAQAPQILPASARDDVSPLGSLSGQVPVVGLGNLVTQGLPTTPPAQRDLPRTPELPLGDPPLPTQLAVTGLGSLPTQGLPGTLPGQRDLPELPLGGEMVAELPVSGLDDLPTQDLSAQRDLPGTPEVSLGGQTLTPLPLAGLGGLLAQGLPTTLPAQRDLPRTPGLPLGGEMVAELPVAGLDDLPTQVLPAQRDLPRTPELPLSGEMAVAGLDDLPTQGLSAQRDLPGTPEVSLGGQTLTPLPLAGLGGLPTQGLPAQRDLPQTPGSPLPVAGLDDLPTQVLPARRDLPQTPGLPLSGQSLPGVELDDLPTQSLPVQRELPQAKVSVAGRTLAPLSGQLPVAALDNLPTRGLPTTLPAQRDLPRTPELPLVGAALAPRSGISAGQFGGFGFGRADLPADANAVTTVIPAIPAAGDPTDITTVLPVIPAVGTRQGAAEAAALELDGSSLDSTRAALANLFTTHPIA